MDKIDVVHSIVAETHRDIRDLRKIIAENDMKCDARFQQQRKDFESKNRAIKLLVWTAVLGCVSAITSGIVLALVQS